MADEKLLLKLREGVTLWNQWRKDYKGFLDLSRTNLAGIDKKDNAPLTKGHQTNLRGIDLSGAEMDRTKLEAVNLSGSNLSNAVLSRTNLRRANLSGADLRCADLYEADLYQANLQGADLSNTRLTRASLVEAKLEGANLENSYIYGTSAWDVSMDESTNQKNLIITDPSRTWEPEVNVDDLEVAQFIYLLLNRKKIRNVLNTLTSKSVLLLGRFTPERKIILDGMADYLRENKLVPIIFDFERSTDRDFTETIKILAGLCLFVVVDLTKPKSVPQELNATIPDYQIPFVPLLQIPEDPYSMFDDFKKYDWLLQPIIEYKDLNDLLKYFQKAVIERAWKKHLELQQQKNEKMERKSIADIVKDMDD
jgi:hypothetical protein